WEQRRTAVLEAEERQGTASSSSAQEASSSEAAIKGNTVNARVAERLRDEVLRYWGLPPGVSASEFQQDRYNEDRARICQQMDDRKMAIEAQHVQSRIIKASSRPATKQHEPVATQRGGSVEVTAASPDTSSARGAAEVSDDEMVLDSDIEHVERSVNLGTRIEPMLDAAMTADRRSPRTIRSVKKRSRSVSPAPSSSQQRRGVAPNSRDTCTACNERLVRHGPG
ncbi:uncharacterized protein JCM15063_006574, partial [Sporobolomyces koalae]|uniref:uncharacterized protein n=1 Tax=Sporobolomyces koalae TaxID=500713 RepID=UPI00317FAF7D